MAASSGWTSVLWVLWAMVLIAVSLMGDVGARRRPS